MRVTVKLKRQGQDRAAAPRTQDYPIEIADDATVMDALLHIRDHVDPSLALRADCLRGFCGSCACRVNGTGVLSCVIPLAASSKGGEVLIEPIREAGVIRDLVYDMDTFLWDKVKAVQPWIDGETTPPAPASPNPLAPFPAREGGTGRDAPPPLVTGEGAGGEVERPMDPKVADDLQDAMSCVMCGLCDEGCTVIAVDKTFLGPAALTKAYRSVRDPRNAATAAARLKALERPTGIWDCTHCFEANGHCPKNINPTNRIFFMRDMAAAQGISHKPAARHHDSLQSSLKRSGWLDEGRLAVESAGWTNVAGLLRLLPTAWRAMLRGKAPMPFMHPKRPGAAQVRRIIEKAETKKR